MSSCLCDWKGIAFLVTPLLLDQITWSKKRSANFRLVCKDWCKVHDNFVQNLQPKSFPSIDFRLKDKFPNVSKLDLSRFWHHFESVHTKKIPRRTAVSLYEYYLRYTPEDMEYYDEEEDLNPIKNEHYNLNALDGLVHLNQLKLDIVFGKWLYRPYVLSFVGQFTSLTSLHIRSSHHELLAYCEQESVYVDSDDFKCLRSLQSLLELRLIGLLGFENTAMFHIGELISLTALTFVDMAHHENEIDDDGLKALTKLTNLSDLDVSEFEIESLMPVTSLVSLSRLVVKRTVIQDEELAHLSKLEQLTSLDLSVCEYITDDGLPFLTDMNLSSLKLRSVEGLTDVGLRTLGMLTSLKVLDVAECDQITTNGIAHLKTLFALEELDISDCGITDDVGAHLVALRSLISINLSCNTRINGSCLRQLSTLTNLTELRLSRCHKLTNKELGSLTSLTSLKRLNLSKCKQIGDESLTTISDVASLSDLNLDGCQLVTDVGIVPLARICTLTRLDLCGCPEVTSNGIKHLSHLPILDTLIWDDKSAFKNKPVGTAMYNMGKKAPAYYE